MSLKPHQLFYSVSFLQFFMSEITGTTLILFLLSKGLSLENANYLLAIFFLSVFLLEVPTGAIADKYGRKASVLLGLICYLIYSIIFMQANELWLLMLAQIFGGLATCLQSGALESWVVENSDRPIEKLFTTANSMQYISGIFCGVLGASLAAYNYSFPWIASIISILAAILLCTRFMTENNTGNHPHTVNSLSAIVHESVRIGLNHKVIWIVFIVGLFISFSNSAGNTFQQPRLVGLSEQGVWLMGIIKAAYSLCMTFGSYLVRKLYNKYNDMVVLMLSCSMIGIWLVLAGALNSFYPMLVTFLVYEIGRGMYPAANLSQQTDIQ